MSDIKLKNQLGEDIILNGVEKITVPLADGSGTAEYSEGGGSDPKEAEAFILSEDFYEITEYENDKIIKLKDYAFDTCPLLASVSLPACTIIGENAFYGCPLSSVSFPACTTIKNGAFNECSSLITANFPVCTTINNGAFAFCPSLTTLYVGTSISTVCTLNEYVFEECIALESIYVPADLVDAYKTADNWSDYADKIKPYTGE